MIHSPGDVASLRDLLRSAFSSATPTRITGAGTWLDAGRPVSAYQTLSTAQLTGVVEYTPGDLVITVRAGTTLRDIELITAPHGQMLALDPFCTANGLDTATIGATVATASSGALAHGFGRVRDLALGCTFVSGDGTVVRGGGRVVKNVAGFDLVRLTTGAWGTLGVISDVSLRLHARPIVDETFAIALADLRTLDDTIAMLNSAPLLANASTLASLVILGGTLPTSLSAHQQLRGASAILLCRAMGNRARVDAQHTALRQLGDLVSLDTLVWRDVRSCDSGQLSARLADAPSRTAALVRNALESLSAIAHSSLTIIVEPLRGAVRVSAHIASDTPFALPAHAVLERAPAAFWAAHASHVSDTVSVRLRAMFDPASILNPGILGA